MAGVSLINAAASSVETGPSFCIIGLTKPTASPIAKLDLVTEPTLGWKTPDLTAHPNATCVGYTTDGWTFTPNVTEGAKLSVDELDSPIRIGDSTVAETISGKLVSLAIPDLLKKVFGLQDLHVLADPFTRVTDLSGGQPETSVAWIWRVPDPANAGQFKYRYRWYYNCKQTAHYSGNLKRGELFSVDVKFEATSVLGHTWEEYKEE